MKTQAEACLPFYLGGIQVNEPDHDHWMHCLKGHGMNTVSITVYARQGDWDSAKLWYEAEEPFVMAEIRAAKAHGMKAVLIPRVALDSAFPRNAHLWHGMIMPQTDEQLEQWFQIYRNYILKWAEIAQEEKVDLFAIGSELKALTHTLPQDKKMIETEAADFQFWYESLPDRVIQAEGEPEKVELYHQDVLAMSRAYLSWGKQTYHPAQVMQQRRALLLDYWQDLIRAVRKIYSGRLIYASNFDSYQNKGFWQQLDMMGINAYFKLNHSIEELPVSTLYQTVNNTWQSVFSDISRFRQEQGLESQSLLFTEIGFTRRKLASVEPWSYGGKSVVESGEHSYLIDWDQQPLDDTERVESIRALKNTVQQPQYRYFRGLLYWKLSTVPEHRAIEPFMIYIGRGSMDPALDYLRQIRQIH
ncbi:MAG: hypothetical protein AAF649_04190 [Verrucomicrobiota bacterium]